MTHSYQRIAVLGGPVVGAIAMDHEITGQPISLERAEAMALQKWPRPLLRASSRAYGNVATAIYSRAILHRMRAEMRPFDRRALIQQLAAERSKHHNLYAYPAPSSYRQAVAHVLLERGILVGEDDRSGRIYLVSRSIKGYRSEERGVRATN